MNIEKQEARWAKQKDVLERKQKIKEEKQQIKGKAKSLSTSKKLIWFLFANCTIIEAVTFWITIKSIDLSYAIGYSPDFTPLVALIGAVVGEVIGYGVYAAKAAKENVVGGICYDLAMLSEPITGPSDNKGDEEHNELDAQ